MFLVLSSLLVCLGCRLQIYKFIFSSRCRDRGFGLAQEGSGRRRACRGRWAWWGRAWAWRRSTGRAWTGSGDGLCPGPVHGALSSEDDHFLPHAGGSDGRDDGTNQIMAQVLGPQEADVTVHLKTTTTITGGCSVLLFQPVIGELLML